jgi:hypothetical protein
VAYSAKFISRSYSGDILFFFYVFCQFDVLIIPKTATYTSMVHEYDMVMPFALCMPNIRPEHFPQRSRVQFGVRTLKNVLGGQL